MTMGELPAEVLDAILVHLSGLDDADLIAIHKGIGPDPPQIKFPEDPDEEEDGSASEWSRTEESGSDETGPEEFPLDMNRPGVARPNRRGFERTPSGIFLSLPKDTRDDIINFSVINRKFCGVFRDRFRVNHIFKMPEEILRIILDYLTPELDHLLAPNLRESLSVESFASIPHVPQNFSQISELNLVNKRFRDLGLNRQFLRVETRFSSAGFQRLRNIAGQEEIRLRVQKFSYMVPRFYPAGVTRLQEILSEITAKIEDLEHQLDQRAQSNSRRHIDRQVPTDEELRSQLERKRRDQNQVRQTLKKAKDQKRVIELGIDTSTLSYAIRKFENLQQLRLMPVTDALDAGWARLLSRNNSWAADFRPSELTEACEHATKTLTTVLLQSPANISRFSSRFMHPKTPLTITQNTQTAISKLAPRLSCLELDLKDDRINLNEKIHQLSGLFLVTFSNTINLTTLHIGFGNRVSVPLELVFHNIQFSKLEHIGLHLWLLNASEIIDFLRRHKENLKSLRLRHISLREGKWKEVLGYIRGDLGLRNSSRHLEWVSLRGIGYEERTNVLGGMSFAQPSHRNSPRFDMDSDVGSSDDENNRSQERWRSNAKSSCKCFKGLAWDDLDDNGITVEKQQWKMWEKWAIAGCSTHDPHASPISWIS